MSIQRMQVLGSQPDAGLWQDLKRDLAVISSPEALRGYVTPTAVEGLDADQANLVAKLCDLSTGTYVPHRYRVELAPEPAAADEQQEFDKPSNAAGRVVTRVTAPNAQPALVLESAKKRR